MSVSEDIIEILERINSYTGKDITEILSLVLSRNEINIGDKLLLKKLMDYEIFQEYIGYDDENSEEDSW